MQSYNVQSFHFTNNEAYQYHPAKSDSLNT